MINEVRRAQSRYGAQAIVLFDHPEASESRRDLYEGYKAGRDKNEEDSEAIRAAVSRCQHEFPVWYDSDYEADDLIASISEAYPEHGMYIMSRDSDLNALLKNPLRLQIVSTIPLDLMAEADVIGCAMVEAKLGIKIEQFDEYRALIGDSSDNLQGVKGIGPKTARQILSEYETVEMAVVAGSQLSISKARRKALKQAWDNGEFHTSLQLTRLARDAPIPDSIQGFIARVLAAQPRINFGDLDW